MVDLAMDLRSRTDGAPIDGPRNENGLCLLVVEDDLADAYLIHRALLRHPAIGKVVHATDGVEALEIIERDEIRPDLAFIDLHMPRKGGVDLLTSLFDRPGLGFPKVVLTSSTAPVDTIRSRLGGADRVIVKPSSVGDMEAALASAVDSICHPVLRSTKPSPTPAPETAPWRLGFGAKAVTSAITVSQDAIRSADERALGAARSAATLRSAFTMARLGGWEMDFSTQKVTLSPELRALFGDATPVEMEMTDFVLLWIAEDRRAFLIAMDQALKDGGRLTFEGRTATPAGGTRWWRIYGEPVIEGDRCVALRGAAQDITP